MKKLLTRRSLKILKIVVLFASLTSASTLSGIASGAGQEYNDADAALNQVYKEVLSAIRDPKERLLYVAAQQTWIKNRDANVAFFSEHYPYSKGGLFYNIHLINERIAFLKSILATSPSVDPTGEIPGGY